MRRACEVEPCVYPRAFICYPTFYREFYRIWVEPSHPPTCTPVNMSCFMTGL